MKGPGGHTRLLAHPCGASSAALTNQRKRILEGRHPESGNRAKVVSTTPLGVEALTKRSLPRNTRLSFEAPVAPAMGGPSLEAALAWVGIALLDLPRLEREAQAEKAQKQEDGMLPDPEDVWEEPAPQAVAQELGIQEEPAQRRRRFKF